MPAERVSMRKIREALRLTHAMGMSRRLVGEATGIGKTAVGEYVRRAAVAGLSWPLPDEIDDAELERRLFPPAAAGSSAARTDPDWSHIHTQMKRRGVTLALLWQEYRGEHAQGYAYSWFCERYSDWRKRITPTMRQTHDVAHRGREIGFGGGRGLGGASRLGIRFLPQCPHPCSQALAAKNTEAGTRGGFG